mgnify:CR=1 FL=1
MAKGKSGVVYARREDGRICGAAIFGREGGLETEAQARREVQEGATTTETVFDDVSAEIREERAEEARRDMVDVFMGR